MKALPVLFALLATFAVHASTWRRVCFLQSAGRAARQAAALRIGRLACHANAGAVLAGLLSELPGEDLLGPMRPDDGLSLAVYCPDEDGTSRHGVGGKASSVAVLCPVREGCAAFRKAHGDCVETNGCLLAGGRYVGFSSDGRWAAIGSGLGPVRRALAERDALTAFDTNDVLRFSCDAKGLRTLSDDSEDLPFPFSEAGGLESVDLAMRVGDKGLDLCGTIAARKGSPLDLFGRRSFPFDPFSRVGTNDVFVAASAEPALSVRHLLPAGSLRRVRAACRRHVIDLSPLRLTETNGIRRLVLDAGRCAALVAASRTNMLAKVSDAAFARDLEAALARPATNAVPATVAAVPEILALSVAGHEMEVSPGERFQLTVPEVVGKRPFAVAVLSPSGLFKALSPCVAALLPEDVDEEEVALSCLPEFLSQSEEAEAGLAAMGWREGDRLRFLVRVSGDELFGLVGSLAMLCGIPLAEADEDLPWEDGEDDSEEDGDSDAGEKEGEDDVEWVDDPADAEIPLESNGDGKDGDDD